MPLQLSPELETIVLERAVEEGVSVENLLARIFVSKDSQAQSAINPQERVKSLLTRLSIEDGAVSQYQENCRYGGSSAKALFQKWEEEESQLTEEEREAEDRLWADFQFGLDEERFKSGMRTLF